ncbi:MAG: ATPase [Flavobacteriaceae bacterium]|nr:ATPase [Flavobacteriaceae bacterium]
MEARTVTLYKYSGEEEPFSREKLKASLKQSGAGDEVIDRVLHQIINEVTENTSTKQIHQRAFQLLKQQKSYFAAKYKLKRALFELGPTGYPFEKFTAKIFEAQGDQVEVGKMVSGKCVNHEIDVFCVNGENVKLVECKFHSEQGRPCDVKIPLYIRARFDDIFQNWYKDFPHLPKATGWLVTNTRFTDDAYRYGTCADLNLLSWDLPKGKSLKNLVDLFGLYPITCLTRLTRAEKQQLVEMDIVLCQELINRHDLLHKIGLSKKRIVGTMGEVGFLCQNIPC